MSRTDPVWVVVVAGGSGSRFGERKQFLQLAGLPVAAWSVRAAKAVADGVVLVVPADGDGTPGDGTSGAPVPESGTVVDADRVVPGGPTRSDSVRAGLSAVPGDAGVIVVHDAARPLATPDLFASVIGLVRSGAVAGAIPVLPVADTVKRVVEGRVVAAVDRDGLVAVQTPQAFDAGALRSVHARGGEATDDAGLLEAAGYAVGTVDGDPRNLKLTVPGDFALVEALLVGYPS